MFILRYIKWDCNLMNWICVWFLLCIFKRSLILKFNTLLIMITLTNYANIKKCITFKELLVIILSKFYPKLCINY